MGRKLSWKSWVLVVAGVYNMVWGMFLVAFPQEPFRLAGIAMLANPMLLWGVGLGVGAFGAGYLIAASDPLRFWPIVLAGLLSKVISPVGFVFLALKNAALWSMSWVVVVNDFIWWGPFVLILASAYRRMSSRSGSSLAVGGARGGE